MPVVLMRNSSDAGKVLIFGSRINPRSFGLRYTVDSDTLNPLVSSGISDHSSGQAILALHYTAYRTMSKIK